MIIRFKGEYRFLSSFYDQAPFAVPWWKEYWPDSVPTREHAYQAHKTLDWDEAKVVLTQYTAGQAKRAGQLVTIRADWEKISRRVMFQLIAAQLKQNPSLEVQLLRTAGNVLVEGNTWGDDYWGAVPRDPIKRGIPLWTDVDGTEYQGQNWLGRIWMMQRDLLE